MLSLPKLSHRAPLIKLLVIVFMLAIAASSALPNYLSGNWFLQKVPESSQLRSLQTLQRQGLHLPGWRTTRSQIVEIGGHKWTVQELTAPPAQQAVLMLRPQVWQRDQPEVDWMDIKGTEGWTTDSWQSLQVAPHVEAQFFRAWSSQQSYAVLQWYAWANGGHPAPNRWFWADQWTQLRHRRHSPWAAVSLLIPVQPLDDIATVRPQALALGSLIQSTLLPTLTPQ